MLNCRINSWEIRSTLEPPHQPGRPTRNQVHRQLEDLIAELRTRMGGLPSPAEAQSVWREIWYQEAHNSTALEGNSLVLKQVEYLLGQGRAVGDKELKDYLEVRGYADAAEWVYGQGMQPERGSTEQLTVTEIREVHALAMTKVWSVAPHPHAGPNEGPGSFRRHDIEPFPSGMKPPEWTDVPALFHTWVQRVNKLGHGGSFATDTLPGLQGTDRPLMQELAAAHAELERIHPFIDGNGRAGRLVLNLLLARLGYPPAIIYKRQRSAYLDALRKADSGDDGALGEIIARAVRDNLFRFVIPAVAGPNRLVPLAALQSREVTHTALRLAAARGRLKAQQGPDATWRSTKQWVADYLATRYRRE
jgi:Fic family protein